MTWMPPNELNQAQLAEISDAVLSLPDIPFTRRPYERRIESSGMNWDVGGALYTPDKDADILRGADGKRVGIFLLHGGGGDHRQMDNLGSTLAQKFGIVALALSYPGHVYYGNDDHEWPGEPLDDGTGTPRLPIWDRQNPITADQCELIVSADNEEVRKHRGTQYFLAARPGTEFYKRQAAWPLAYEKAYTTAIEETFPAADYSVYLHGHSTGGPQVHYLLQRLPHVAGLVGMETSSFGYIKKQMDPASYGGAAVPFNYLTLRTWRDTARYMGAEVGEDASRYLPLIMEKVFESWDAIKGRSGFKSEHFIQFCHEEALASAANAVADFMEYDSTQREEIVQRYLGYVRPLPESDARPLPPLLYIINEGSRDHRLDNYNDVLFPALSEIAPRTKKSLTFFQGGQHNYNKPAPGLPRGSAIVGAKIWRDAIVSGFYEQTE